MCAYLVKPASKKSLGTVHDTFDTHNTACLTEGHVYKIAEECCLTVSVHVHMYYSSARVKRKLQDSRLQMLS